VAAKVVSKIERGRPATLVHGFVLAVFRAQRSGARARSIMKLYHFILVNALLGWEFGIEYREAEFERTGLLATKIPQELSRSR
jgi:hypothetical protein